MLSLHLSLSDIYQIGMEFKGFTPYIIEIKIVPDGEIKQMSFSSSHIWTKFP